MKIRFFGIVLSTVLPIVSVWAETGPSFCKDTVLKPRSNEPEILIRNCTTLGSASVAEKFLRDRHPILKDTDGYTTQRGAPGVLGDFKPSLLVFYSPDTGKVQYIKNMEFSVADLARGKGDKAGGDGAIYVGYMDEVANEENQNLLKKNFDAAVGSLAQTKSKFAEHQNSIVACSKVLKNFEIQVIGCIHKLGSRADRWNYNEHSGELNTIEAWDANSSSEKIKLPPFTTAIRKTDRGAYELFLITDKNDAYQFPLDNTSPQSQGTPDYGRDLKVEIDGRAFYMSTSLSARSEEFMRLVGADTTKYVVPKNAGGIGGGLIGNGNDKAVTDVLVPAVKMQFDRIGKFVGDLPAASRKELVSCMAATNIRDVPTLKQTQAALPEKCEKDFKDDTAKFGALFATDAGQAHSSSNSGKPSAGKKQRTK